MRNITVKKLLLMNGHGQTLAALGAAAGEDLASIGGGHAGAESMSAKTGNLMGLIGSFHDNTSLSECCLLRAADSGGHPGRVQLYVTIQITLQADLFSVGIQLLPGRKTGQAGIGYCRVRPDLKRVGTARIGSGGFRENPLQNSECQLDHIDSRA
jgi:hypothetical protein